MHHRLQVVTSQVCEFELGILGLVELPYQRAATPFLLISVRGLGISHVVATHDEQPVHKHLRSLPGAQSLQFGWCAPIQVSRLVPDTPREQC